MLEKCDADLAEECRLGRCPKCGGWLDRSDHRRNARVWLHPVVSRLWRACSALWGPCSASQAISMPVPLSPLTALRDGARPEAYWRLLGLAGVRKRPALGAGGCLGRRFDGGRPFPFPHSRCGIPQCPERGRRLRPPAPRSRRVYEYGAWRPRRVPGPSPNADCPRVVYIRDFLLRPIRITLRR